MSLFDAAAEGELARRAPLAARLRPANLEEVAGQRHLVGPGGPLRAMLEADRLSSVVLWGPPGTGKTTLARLAACSTEKEFVPLSAVSAGVRDVRDAAAAARRRLGETGRGTILFIDEVHRFNKAQQDALLPFVEDGLVVFIGATTENPVFEINGPLLSRATLMRTEPLDPIDVAGLLLRGLERLSEESGSPVEASEEVIEEIAAVSGGDARRAVNLLEVVATLAALRSRRAGRCAERGVAPARDETPTIVRIEADDVASAGVARVLPFTRDSHFDIASALIKSVRGSDPDAGVYWLARMLAEGGDPRFVARRLVILASEDIGEADPTALTVAVAAAAAVDLVGLPEAALNLAQATVHLACAPKSNRSATALWRAQEVVARAAGAQPPVPFALRDTHGRAATVRSAGSASPARHGPGDEGRGGGGVAQDRHPEEYAYPHDDPRGWVDQRYLPEAVDPSGHLAGEGPFYEPSGHGAEADVAGALRRRRQPVGSETGGDEPGRGPGSSDPRPDEPPRSPTSPAR